MGGHHYPGSGIAIHGWGIIICRWGIAFRWWGSSLSVDGGACHLLWFEHQGGHCMGGGHGVGVRVGVGIHIGVVGGSLSFTGGMLSLSVDRASL